MPSFHSIQAPLDGAIAAVGPGPVSGLDLIRMVAAPDFDPVVVELERGELRTAIDAYWATADPRTVDSDTLAWNWCRMPAGVSTPGESPTSVAVIPGVVAHLSEWLGRDLVTQPGGCTAIHARVGALRD
jgi:hypothetical protein